MNLEKADQPNPADALIEISSALGKLERFIKARTKPCDFLNFNEACDFLNMSESLLRKFVFEKKVPHKKVGRRLKFSRKQLTNWVDSFEGVDHD